MFTIQTESVTQVRRDIQPLLEDHYRELTLHKDVIKLNVDWEKYLRTEAAGGLVAVTLRKGGKLAGYSVFFLAPHMHYKDSWIASNDVLYISPEHRKGVMGFRLMKWSETYLQGRGITKVLWHVKPANDFSGMLEKMGYEKEEVIMGKILRG